MEIIPAIDLRDGKCVRLIQGDYSRETIFSDDPAAMARKWTGLGAKRLHIVDLDGAASGSGSAANQKALAAIVKAVQVPVQVGGGIRSLTTVENLVGIGIDRVILGTSAIRDKAFVQEAIAKHKQRIIVGIDARGGMAAASGWKEQTTIRAIDLAWEMQRMGVQRIVYTDISKDGMLEGPDFNSCAELLDKTSLKVIASGGITTIDHLKRLADIGTEGAIVGRAIYTGALDLKQAVEALAG